MGKEVFKGFEQQEALARVLVSGQSKQRLPELGVAPETLGSIDEP